MSEDSKSRKFVGDKVSKLLDEMCLKYESEHIEQDIVELFEDIIKFFLRPRRGFFKF